MEYQNPVVLYCTWGYRFEWWLISVESFTGSHIPSVELRAKTSDALPFLLEFAFGNHCMSVGQMSSGSVLSTAHSFVSRFHRRILWSSATLYTSSGLVHPTQLTSSVCAEEVKAVKPSYPTECLRNVRVYYYFLFMYVMLSIYMSISCHICMHVQVAL